MNYPTNSIDNNNLAYIFFNMSITGNLYSNYINRVILTNTRLTYPTNNSLTNTLLNYATTNYIQNTYVDNIPLFYDISIKCDKCLSTKSDK